MNYSIVGKHRYDSSETCSICSKFIAAGQIYVRAEAKTAHYRCAKKRGWEKTARAKTKKQHIKREIAPPRIRVIKKKLL